MDPLRSLTVALVAAVLSIGVTVSQGVPSAGLAALGPGTVRDAAGILAATGSLAAVRPDSASGGAAASLGLEASVEPAAARQPMAAPLPACQYRDVLTRYPKPHQWRKTLLDPTFMIRKGYAPKDLVPVSQAGIAGTGMVRSFVINDLRAMANAARRAGKPIAVRSAYRSYSTQVATFQHWVRQVGYDQALLYAARPGHSEHQLGTTIDFRSASSGKAPWDYKDWGQTPAGKWMINNSWKFGFVLSYPKGKRRQSCYGYEPWHYRYVGRPLARAIRESGKVPRAFLWERFHSTP
jgi:zinc D-Ala-D-Ala carboxypeptidase